MPCSSNQVLRLPFELRKNLLPVSSKREVFEVLRTKSLNTVCEEAKCPNIGECFSNKTATFMILGDRCTRRCKFCAVKTARPFLPDINEPKSLTQAVADLRLKHVVITSVDRDDLGDLGANHFVDCIKAIRDLNPQTTIELLTPDFKAKEHLIDLILKERPEVFGHNIETILRLFKSVRPQSNYEHTKHVLQYVAASKVGITKSGMMVGLGESDSEVEDNLYLLDELGVKSVTIGQYLRPSLNHWPVDRYVAQSSYDQWKVIANKIGFKSFYAGSFVRSSYHAKENFVNP